MLIHLAIAIDRHAPQLTRCMSRWPDKQSISETLTAQCLDSCGMRGERRADWLAPSKDQPMMELLLPSHCQKRLDPLMVPQNACTVLRVAEILHCVSFPSQQKHVCFSRHEHFVQTPDLNISMGSDFQIVSLMTRFFLCCCWILVTHAVFFLSTNKEHFAKLCTIQQLSSSFLKLW